MHAGLKLFVFMHAGGGTGDPHYINMFRQRFDFHANGEYLLMEAGPDRSQVQGHLQKSGYPALHRAFAFGEPGRYAYQVSLGSYTTLVYRIWEHSTQQRPTA